MAVFLGALAFPFKVDKARLAYHVVGIHVSVQFDALDHRQEALDYALEFGRGLKRDDADKFVGMYVNDWTLDFGDVGRKSVAELLRKGYESGVVPKLVVPEFF